MGIKVTIEGEEVELVGVGLSKGKNYKVYKAPEQYSTQDRPPLIVTVHVAPGWKPSNGDQYPAKSMLKAAE